MGSPIEKGDKSPERLKPRRGHVVLDLDGVIVRWPQYDLPIQSEQAEFFACLGGLRKEGVDFSVLTNRSSAAMQMLAYQLGENNGIWSTESGATEYNVEDHQTAVLDEWVPFARHRVPVLRTFLEDNFGITGRNIIPTSDVGRAQFEPGSLVKTVVVPPPGWNAKDYFNKVMSPVWVDHREEFDDFVVEVGKGIDFDPAGLSKEKGLEHLLTANRIDPEITPVIFIADARRDCSAATYLLERGGYAGAVGNSAEEYLNLVSKHERGIVPVQPGTIYHRSVVDILNQFLTKLK